MASANVSTVNGRTHQYHAQAVALSGNLRLPVEQKITPQTHVSLPAEGGYISQRAEKYRLESVISMRSSYTHVHGNLSGKPGQGWLTTTTSVVEGLNVEEVVTADRVVGQMIMEHPLEGYVPRVSFLGTRFDNLRIAGHPVEIKYDLNVLGSKPANDGAYATDSGFIGRVSGLLDTVRGREELPKELRERYNRLSSTLGSPQEEVECSLVKSVTGTFPGLSFGPFIVVPDFGVIYLGKVVVKHEDFKEGTETPKKTTITYTMIDLHLGCPSEGNGSVGTGGANGGTAP
jgi:hypothetical protein